jgi:5'-nucleotidase
LRFRPFPGRSGNNGFDELKILLSNDDGIHAPGIQKLAEVLSEIGEVTVVAPDRDRSAASHSLTRNRPLTVSKINNNQYAVKGTPVDCVNLAINGLLPERPDIVIGGINLGGNLGDDVTYSGTVSVAREGTLIGIPSFAVSLVSRTSNRFGPAARFAKRLACFVKDNGLPQDTFLNVNVPDLEEDQIQSYQITIQGKRIYRLSVNEQTDINGEKLYWIDGDEPGWQYKEKSDFEAIEANSISITPLHLDLTNHATLDELKKWRL